MVIANAIQIGRIRTTSGGSGDNFTNAQGFQITSFVDDSFELETKNITRALPTPAAQTAYYWNHTNSTNIQITTTDVLGASNGSMIPQYCISKYNTNSKKTIAVLCGFS